MERGFYSDHLMGVNGNGHDVFVDTDRNEEPAAIGMYLLFTYLSPIKFGQLTSVTSTSNLCKVLENKELISQKPQALPLHH
jgi:hypothetical protein